MKVFCRFAPNGTSADRKKLSIEVEDNPENSTIDLCLYDLTVGSAISLGCHGVFGPTDKQRHVYNAVGLPLIEKALEGDSCALLAYGQTASGKTHSMLGPSGGDPNQLHSDLRGVIPRLVEDLFSAGSSIEEAPNQFKLNISFFEIYNEIVTDLVGKHDSCRRSSMQNESSDSCGDVRGSGAPGGGYTFKPTERHRLATSLKRLTCSTAKQALDVITALCALRSIGSTHNNLRSSRSHVVLQLSPSITASGTAPSNDKKRVRGKGRITLVDLAGSESLKAANASWAHLCTSSAVAERNDIATVCSTEIGTKDRQMEMKSINTSLFALKKVVHALHERSEHVPYKDSVLTVVLQDCLPAPGCTTLLVCSSTAHKDINESIASLRFAAEASKIQSGFGIDNGKKAGRNTRRILQTPSPPQHKHHSSHGNNTAGGPNGGPVDYPDDASPSNSEERRRHRHHRSKTPTRPPATNADPLNELKNDQRVIDLLAENVALRNQVDTLARQVKEMDQQMGENNHSAHRLLEHCNRLATGYTALEEEVEQLRLENQQLRAAGHHFAVPVSTKDMNSSSVLLMREEADVNEREEALADGNKHVRKSKSGSGSRLPFAEIVNRCSPERPVSSFAGGPSRHQGNDGRAEPPITRF